VDVDDVVAGGGDDERLRAEVRPRRLVEVRQDLVCATLDTGERVVALDRPRHVRRENLVRIVSRWSA
jgi:hypothetical protein